MLNYARVPVNYALWEGYWSSKKSLYIAGKSVMWYHQFGK